MYKTVHLLVVGFFLLTAFCSSAAGIDAQTVAELKSLPADTQQKLLQQYRKDKGGSSSPVSKTVSVQSVPAVKDKPKVKHASSAKKAASAVASGSLLETQYRQRFQSSMAAAVKQFGYNLFSSSSTKVPAKVVPNDDYLITPGDQMRIRLWGAMEDTQYVATVENDGTINVPKMGVVNVLGARLGKLETIIGREVNKYIQGVQVDVSLENLHSVEVYVVGEVAQPGLHVVPAFSTIFKGLQAAAGVKKTGTLRQITLHRQGQEDSHIDLYNLLLNGKRGEDQVLQDGDVVFVPRIGSTAAVVGAVYQPAVFELKGSETIVDLLSLAGGVLPNAYSQTMYLKYYDKHDTFQIEDLHPDKKNGFKTKIIPGCVVEIPYINKDKPDAVTLIGHVKMKQTVKYRQGLQLGDLLHSVEQLKPEAVLDYALLHRYNPASTRYEVHKFPLQKFLSGDYRLTLQPQDQIEILSRAQFGIEEYVTVDGAVWKPGTFVFSPGMTAADLIALAGGVTIGARANQVELSCVDLDGGTSNVVCRSLNGKQQNQVEIKPGAHLNIPRIKDATRIATVKLDGEVRYPGTYSIAEGEHMSSVIKRAGGFTDQAYFYGASFTSANAQKIQQSSINKMIATLKIESKRNTAELEQASASAGSMQAAQLSNVISQKLINELSAVKAKGRISINLAPLSELAGSIFDMELQDGDALHVPMKPSFVSVVGSIYSPNSYLYRPGLTIGDYLKKSGGPTKGADEDYIYVQRANGEVFSIQQTGMFSSFYKRELMPGDTIVVLEDLDRVPGLRLFKDITEIVFRIATTAGIAFAI